MVKIIRQAIAHILFLKLIANFDDLEGLSLIQRSLDFKLLVDMESLIDEDKVLIDENNHNVDYDLVVGVWNKLQESVKKLNEEYNDLISRVKVEFEIQAQDDFLLTGTLIKHEKYIRNKINKNQKESYSEYISKANILIIDYKINLLQYHTADLHDRFLGKIDLIDEGNIKYRKIPTKGTKIYLDQNAVGEIIGNKKYKEAFLRASKEGRFSFFYSSYLIEDAINMNPIFLKEYLEVLSTLTKNKMIGFLDEGIDFVTEDVNETISRVKEYSKLTKAYEESKFIEVLKHYYSYPDLRKGNALSNEVSKNLIGFFKTSSKLEYDGFDSIVEKFSNNDCIQSFVNNGEVGASSLSDKRDVISNFSELFDFINFETEKVSFANKNKIFSSYRDKQHLEHAYICDFFLTNDARLKNRGTLIYNIINIDTKLISVKEFFNDYIHHDVS